MTAGTQEHWTGDEELLAHYVLGRIPVDARVPLDAHLTGCEYCRKAVAAERLLAAGVRLAGRREMRRSLARNIRALPHSSPPWPRIFAAAAVIVIAGALVLYSRWMAVEQERPQEIHPADDRAIPAPGVPRAAPGVPAGKMERKSTPSTGVAPGPGERTAAPQPLKTDAEAATATAPKETAPEPGPTGGPGSWWTGIHVLPGGSGDSVQSDVRPATREAESGAMEMDAARSRARETIVLDQRPLSDLPESAAVSHPGVDRGEVPIRVEHRDGRTHLTLYTASPFDPEELRSALVRREPGGVMTITIGAGMIVVHIPPENAEPSAAPGVRRR